MKSQFVIFVIIGALLVPAIYSSSTFAATPGKSHCYVSARNPADYICVGLDGNGKITAVFYCPNYTGQGGCIRVYSSTESDTGSGLPSEVSNALDAATQESQNTTKVPKGSFLNDGGVLKGQDDNQSTSKTIVGPQDRFCVEGTGGDTGSPCLPCDPGLKFEVGCIDVTTGGPLDMQTAPSESEEDDDTSPKDLDGSNNDENGPEVNPGTD